MQVQILLISPKVLAKTIQQKRLIYMNDQSKVDTNRLGSKSESNDKKTEPYGPQVLTIM